MTIARHTVANLLGGLAPLIVALVTVPAFLRLVGTERYGVLAVLWTLLTYFTFFDFGFGRAVAQRMAKIGEEEAERRSDLLWTAILATMLLGALGTLLLWSTADLFLQHSVQLSDQGRAEIRGAIDWLLPALPVVLLTSVLRGALQARLRFVELNVIEILTSILTQALPLCAALMGFVGLDVLVPVTLVSRLVSASLLLYVAIRRVPICRHPAFRRSDIAHLAHYGGWASVMAMTVPLLVTADRLVIAAMQGADRVPYYTIPFDLVSKAMIITTSISGALFPRLIAAAGCRAMALARDASDMLVAIMTPVIIVGLFTIHPFMRIWVGDGFAQASAGVAEILMLGIWANAWCAAHQSLLLGRDNPRTVVLVYVLEFPVYVGLLWVGLRFGGLLGAASVWSLRAIVEASIFLVIAGSWRAAVSRSMLQLFLVIASLGVVLATPTNSVLHWMAGGLLLVAALLNRWQLLISAARALKPHRPSQFAAEAERTRTSEVAAAAVRDGPDRQGEAREAIPVIGPSR